MPLDSLSLEGSPPPPLNRDRDDDKRPRKEKPFIIPDINFCHKYTKSIWRGMITIRYERMSLWDFDYATVTEKDDLIAIDKIKEACLPIIRKAHVESDIYKEWLRLYYEPGLVLPHIHWNGYVTTTSDGDGGASLAAWKIYALTLT